jgi:hypothetical protein
MLCDAQMLVPGGKLLVPGYGLDFLGEPAGPR